MGRRDKEIDKILDVDASMQGTLTFKDPVNLRINGNFDGKLQTKGSLTIGENASIRADIIGEDITVGGKITGNITAQKKLDIRSSAHIVGDVETPLLSMQEGAVLQGKLQMLGVSGPRGEILDVEELAKYLEVNTSNILDWAKSGRIPAFKDGEDWKFDRKSIEEWIVKEKVR